MFIKFKTLEEAFRRVRRLSLGFVLLSALISWWAIYNGRKEAERSRNTIYLLMDEKVLEAIAVDRNENLPVELRDHLRMFHHFFFDLGTDEKAIRASINRSYYLADGSAKALYDNLVESGFVNGLISGNISQSVELDSIWLNTDREPYAFRCMGVQTLTRSSNTTTRSIVTQGYIRRTVRSDYNPHGFQIERFEVVENKELKTVNRWKN